MGHSNEARKTLDKYELGWLPPSERAKDPGADSAGGGGGGSMAIIAVGGVALAIAGYYYSVVMPQE